LEEILNHNFLGVDVGLKLFFICTLEMVVGSFVGIALTQKNC